MNRILAGSFALVVGACVVGPTEDDGMTDYDWGKIDDPNGLGSLLSCPDRQPEVRQQVLSLIADVEGGRPDITTVDDFLAALPMDMRQNIMFWTETRAFQRIYPLEQQQRVAALPVGTQGRTFHSQEGKWCVSPESGGAASCVEARTFVVSTEGDIIGSFTTHPESPSRNTFELAVFDPTQASLDYFDIAFGEGSPRVRKNPSECMRCHGGTDGSINWRMDPYRFWAYATPFNEDVLRKGSIETEWYLSFLDRITAGESVLRRLAPVNDKATIQAALEAGTYYQLAATPASVDFSGYDTPALNYSHQLLEKNACRIASTLGRRTDFDKIKYATVGGLIDCANIDEFFPTEGSYQKRDADQWFLDQRLGLRDGQFSLNGFIEDTQARHQLLLADRVSRRFDHMAQYAGEEQALAEIQAAVAQAPVREGYGVTNYETYSEHIAKTRYLLEPIGIDVSQWSMTVDREFNSHVEFLFPIPLQPVFIDMLQKEFDLDNRIGRNMGTYECYAMGTTNGEQSRSASCRSAIQGIKAQLCTELAAKSRDGLRDFSRPEDRFAGIVADAIDQMEIDARNLADQMTLEELDMAAGQIYTMNCAGCHVAGYSTGPWYYPFHDVSLLDDLLRREKTAAIHALDGTRVGRADTAKGDWLFDYISWGDRIWDRITRHPRQHGIMPRGSRGLRREDKVTLRAHILKVWDSAGN